MSDKFPEIAVEGDSIDGTDFLSRENQLLGDEFKTEQDHEVLAASDDDDEINNFKAQFPDVDDEEEQVPEDEFEDASTEDKNGQFEEYSSSNNYEGESRPLKEWQERRSLEISQREKANAKKKEDIVEKAQQTIDDFYDNYNNKKETNSKRVAQEEEQFLAKRDGFLKRGTLWDRVGELIQEVGEVSSEERDKSRFKGLLKSLKGKENAPGAGGY